MTPHRLRPATHVKSVIDAEGAVLLDVRGGRYFSLNGIAVDIWQKLEEGLSRDELEAYLTSTYDASADRLRSDCRAFLERLENARLIEGADA